VIIGGLSALVRYFGHLAQPANPILPKPRSFAKKAKRAARCLLRGDLFRCLDALAGDIDNAEQDLLAVQKAKQVERPPWRRHIGPRLDRSDSSRLWKFDKRKT
jgi:hypothetical protein